MLFSNSSKNISMTCKREMFYFENSVCGFQISWTWKKCIYQKTILFRLFFDVVTQNVFTGNSTRFFWPIQRASPASPQKRTNQFIRHSFLKQRVQAKQAEVFVKNQFHIQNFFFAFGTKDLNSLEEISEIFVKNVIST